MFCNFLGYYLTLNMSTYVVRHGEGILKTPEINLTSVCLEFSYSLPGTTSGIKVEIETSGGQVETIWQKSGTINYGKWNTKSLVINRNDRYKASNCELFCFMKWDGTDILQHILVYFPMDKYVMVLSGYLDDLLFLIICFRFKS